ncbi:hypothetical protein ACFLZV_02525, partial [Candidatus Margulisiibacteriota bacterium]
LLFQKLEGIIKKQKLELDKLRKEKGVDSKDKVKKVPILSNEKDLRIQRLEKRVSVLQKELDEKKVLLQNFFMTLNQKERVKLNEKKKVVEKSTVRDESDKTEKVEKIEKNDEVQEKKSELLDRSEQQKEIQSSEEIDLGVFLGNIQNELLELRKKTSEVEKKVEELRVKEEELKKYEQRLKKKEESLNEREKLVEKREKESKKSSQKGNSRDVVQSSNVQIQNEKEETEETPLLKDKKKKKLPCFCKFFVDLWKIFTCQICKKNK